MIWVLFALLTFIAGLSILNSHIEGNKMWFTVSLVLGYIILTILLFTLPIKDGVTIACMGVVAYMFTGISK